MHENEWGARRGSDRRPTLVVVAGTRPEAIKLAPVVRALDLRPELRSLVVNSGQHVGAVRTTFAEFGLRCDLELPELPPLPNLAASCDHLRVELRAAVARFRPDIVLVQGDTLTTYAAACAARDEGVRVAHIEAGLRTNSVNHPFPEEWFRRRIAGIASIHFAPSAQAAHNLRDEGIAGSAIYMVGNTGIDSLCAQLKQLNGHRPPDAPRCGVLVTLHRRENYDRHADTVCRALLRIVELRPDHRVVFPVHPNPRVAARIRGRLAGRSGIELVAPMAYGDFIRAAAGAALIISDSGGIQEEAAHLGTPLLVPRCNTERPEALATGFVRLVRNDEDTIVNAALETLDAPRRDALPFDEHAPYGAGSAAHAIVAKCSALLSVGVPA